MFHVQGSCEIIQFAAWVQGTVGMRSHLEEEAMKTHYRWPWHCFTGIGIGAAAVHTLHAQPKPKAYLVTRSGYSTRHAAEYSPSSGELKLQADGRSREW